MDIVSAILPNQSLQLQVHRNVSTYSLDLEKSGIKDADADADDVSCRNRGRALSQNWDGKLGYLILGKFGGSSRMRMTSFVARCCRTSGWTFNVLLGTLCISSLYFAAIKKLSTEYST